MLLQVRTLAWQWAGGRLLPCGSPTPSLVSCRGVLGLCYGCPGVNVSWLLRTWLSWCGQAALDVIVPAQMWLSWCGQAVQDITVLVWTRVSRSEYAACNAGASIIIVPIALSPLPRCWPCRCCQRWVLTQDGSGSSWALWGSPRAVWGQGRAL